MADALDHEILIDVAIQGFVIISRSSQSRSKGVLIMLTPICICGQGVNLHRGQKEKRCPKCGVTLRRDKSGYWAEGLFTTLFTPKDKFLEKTK